MHRSDFSQTLHDHRGILILVCKIGNIDDKEYSRLHEHLTQFQRVELPHDNRTLHLRYVSKISLQYIDWGSFHYHRKLLGIIGIARCSDAEQLQKAEEHFDELKAKHNSTVFDSRLLILGLKDPPTSKTSKDFILLNEDDFEQQVEDQLKAYVSSLFAVLESKRLDKSLEKGEKLSSIRAPIDLDNGQDSESRNNKKKSLGRVKKYVGDLSLLAGLTQDALFHYSVASECLRAVGDSLWLAGALEGLCASSIILRYPQKKSEKCRTLCLSVNNGSVTTNGVSGDSVEESKFRNVTPLLDDDMVERYMEAVRLYSKIRGLGSIEMECHLKCARLLHTVGRKVEANTALQNSLIVNITLTDAEKIQRYCALAVVYRELGFERKAAFYTRVAAMQCISPNLQIQGWPISYALMKDALKGYKMSLDYKELGKVDNYGWPSLQIRVLHELIFIARRLGNPFVAARHMSFLLQGFHQHQNDLEKKELKTQLEACAKQYAGMTSDVQNLDPELQPVPLTRMPLVRSFKVNTLAAHLRPVSKDRVRNTSSSGPFIYSSIRKRTRGKREGIVWVQGQVGEVSMEIRNPMPFELKVNKMTLITSGVDFEAFPACLSLPPNSDYHVFMLLGNPLEPGQLQILGYKVEVLGLESTCVLTEKNLAEKVPELPLVVSVSPSLPLLQLSMSIPRSRPVTQHDSLAMLVTSITLYSGQRCMSTIQLENIGVELVDSISISQEETSDGAPGLLEFSEADITSRLPIHPGESVTLGLGITGVHNDPSDTDLEPSSFDRDSKWQLSALLKFQYSGGRGHLEGLSRNILLSINVTVIPCVVCTNYKLQSFTSNQSEVVLVSDITNKTEYDLEVQYGFQDLLQPGAKKETAPVKHSGPSLILPAKKTTKIATTLPRFHLPKSDQAEDNEDEIKKYSKMVDKMVQITWKLPAADADGIGSLGNLRLTQEMLHKLKPDPVIFVVKVNGHRHHDRPLAITASSVTEISVTLTNVSDCVIHQPCLSVEPYQDYQNGYYDPDIADKMAYIGTMTKQFTQLSPGESIHLASSIMFFYPGKFLVGVTCTEKSAEKRERTQAFSESQQGEAMLGSRSDGHCWRYSPPLEFNVRIVSQTKKIQV